MLFTRILPSKSKSKVRNLMSEVTKKSKVGAVARPRGPQTGSPAGVGRLGRASLANSRVPRPMSKDLKRKPKSKVQSPKSKVGLLKPPTSGPDYVHLRRTFALTPCALDSLSLLPHSLPFCT